ncbi:MAG: class I SAM-dependent methyltransferase [Paraglaciecola sp.]|nr:class I SAM-dependent methyltransferase [Paraglaciecola sp.]
MKKILIYGTSNKALRELPAILMNYTLIGFVDSDLQKQSQTLLGLSIYHFSDLLQLDFDLIIICSEFSIEIERTLTSLNISNFINSKDLVNVQKTSLEIVKYQQSLREKEVNTIPKIPLLAKHIENCQMITNRKKLLELLPKNGVVAELGVATGCFSSDIVEYNHPKKLHLVDIWGSSRYNEGLLKNIETKFDNKIQSGQVVIHRNLSQQAVQDFQDNYFDWIYIDTTHSYQQTTLELLLYSAKMKSGGIIAGHDYMQGNWSKTFKYGVIEAVHEFCVENNYRFKYLTMDISENQSFAIEKIID